MSSVLKGWDIQIGIKERRLRKELEWQHKYLQVVIYDTPFDMDRENDVKVGSGVNLD